jgi:hypothetical protein
VEDGKAEEKDLEVKDLEGTEEKVIKDMVRGRIVEADTKEHAGSVER